MPKCILLPYSIDQGKNNMEIDRHLALLCNNPTHPPILRFYDWQAPTLSLGYNQKIDPTINSEYCLQNNIDIIHRPSGGKGVFHEHEITYCLAGSLRQELFSEGILKTYKRINQAILFGLNLLGIPAKLYHPKKRSRLITPSCFSSFAPYEILVNEKKIAGSAQRRIKGAFFQHGSILIDINRKKLDQIFKFQQDKKDHFDKMTSLKEAGASHLKTDEIISSLMKGFENVFNFTFEKSKAQSLL